MNLASHLRLYRPPPWLIRVLPASSRSFGPPRRMRSAWQLPGLAQPLGDPSEVVFARPKLLNHADPHWNEPFRPTPSIRPFWLRTENARLLAPGAWVVVEPDTFVYDTAFWGYRQLPEARRWHQIFLRKKRWPVRALGGRVLSLASDFAPHSYGHWLIDSLPRWRLVERAGLRLDDFDTIYLPGPDTPSTRQLLAALGIPREKLLTTPPTHDWQIANLTVTSFPGAAGSASRLARETATRLFPPGAPRRRVYLSRDGHRRNFVNHDAVQAVLAEFGFETCNPATDANAIARCAEARIILGIEGSQCFNALFAPAGGALVVIAPDGFHPLPYMQTIAGASGLELFIIGARTTGADASCLLAPDALRSSLREIVARFP